MKLPKTVKTKYLLGTIAISILLFSLVTYLATSSNGFTPPNLYLDSLPSTASYVVQTDGTYVWATRYDGKIEFNGTDASTVIQSAINALTSMPNGGTVFIKAGKYIINSTIVLPEKIALVGEGQPELWTEGRYSGALLWRGDNTNIDLIRSNNTNEAHGQQMGIRLENIQIYGNKNTNTNGDDIVLIGITRPIVRDVYTINSPGLGLKISYCTEVYMENVKVYQPRGRSIQPETGYAESAGALLNQVGEDSVFVKLEGGTNDVGHGFFLNNVWETLFMRLRWNSAPNSGLRLVSVSSTTFINPRANDNAQHGIQIDGGVESTFINIRSYDNGKSANNTYDQIWIGNTRSYRFINGELYSSAANLPRYGINIAGSDAHDIIAENIIVANVATAPFYGFTSPKGKLINCKTDYTTYYLVANSGTATIANGEYVAHGLAGTPTVVTVTTMTPTYGGVPVVVGVASQNATHIQISAYWTNGTAITADAINVSWSAEYKP